jgi:tetratricopeptide (TPR) repeat protein/predicted aspartyl protease
MLRTLTVTLIGIWGAWLTPVAAGAVPEGCKLGMLLQLPITMGGSFKPMADAQIDGHDVRLLVDSGDFYSILSPSTAAEFGLHLEPVPKLIVYGLGGGWITPQFTRANLTLGGVTFPQKRGFLVGGNEMSGGARGALGQDILGIADVEYDLANGVIRLMNPEGKCKGLRPTYWVKRDDPYSVMDISRATPQEPFTKGVGYLNGAKITVMFDTGAGASMLSLHAASRAGIKPGGPGVTVSGVSHGIGPGAIQTWIAPVQSFKIGDEEVRNTHLRFGDIDLGITDMLIGPDFFLSHRVYVASSERKLYFTYNGGPVFNLTTQPEGKQEAARNSDGAAQDQQASTDSGAPGGVGPSGDFPTSRSLAGAATARDITIPSGEPTTADGFFRRGSAYLFRRDYEHALADLRRACELNPQEPRYFFERAAVYWSSNQHELSDADINTALKLKPDYVDALLWRAQRELTRQDKAAAIADLNTADHAAAPQDSLRLDMGHEYLGAEAPSQAIRQYSLWIDAHGEDFSLAQAYLARCWARAVSGQEFEQGLSDCNRALHRISDKSAGLSIRGLVYLRLGKYQRAVSDYNDALKVQPKNAWALYGRGIAESQLKNTSAAEADFNAATALVPHIAEEFKKRGILP